MVLRRRSRHAPPGGAGHHADPAVAAAAVTRTQRLALLAAIMGSFVAVLDSTAVNVALPVDRDRSRRRTGRSAVGGQRLCARARRADPRRRVARRHLRRAAASSRSGCLGFGVTSLACALAPSIGVLVAARIAQGVFGALVVPASLAVIVLAFPADRRGAAVGSWTAWSAIATVIGPLVGGKLVDAASWRWIFAVNLPVILATIVLVMAAVPQRAHTGPAHADRLAGRGPVVPRARRPDAARSCASRESGWGAADVLVPGLAGLAFMGAVPLARVDDRPPDGPALAVRAAQLRRRQPRDPGDVRGTLDPVLLPRAVPAAGRRLHGAPGRDGDDPHDGHHVRALEALRSARRPPGTADVPRRRPTRGGGRAAARASGRSGVRLLHAAASRRCSSSRSVSPRPSRR